DGRRTRRRPRASRRGATSGPEERGTRRRTRDGGRRASIPREERCARRREIVLRSARADRPVGRIYVENPTPKLRDTRKRRPPREARHSQLRERPERDQNRPRRIYDRQRSCAEPRDAGLWRARRKPGRAYLRQDRQRSRQNRKR